MNALVQNVMAQNATSFDHIAIAVVDLERAIEWWTDVMGFTLINRLTTTGESTAMLSAVMKAGALTVVLLQGTSPESQVSRFIEHFGQGVQHVAISVDSLDAVMRALGDAGMKFETQVIGNDGLRQVFCQRSDDAGVRLEFIERRGGTFTPESVEKLFRTLEKNMTF